MKDPIERQAAIDAVNTSLFPKINTAKDAEKALRALPSAEPEIIRCEDCRWWGKMELNDKKGYCHAAKHAHYSANWEISIYRTTSQSFFCADAERR